MRIILLLCSCLLLTFSFTNSAAQSSSTNTLLWRISGNGLQKPSYLFGTMHLKDRRLFFFGDSVYKSLETSDGFAMELDPNEMMDSLYSKMSDKDTTSLLRKLLDEDKYEKVSKKLEKKLGIPADKITRKKLIELREGWYYKINKKDDMKAAVDLYLYDLAHKQGKWLGGIEDVNDQMDIKDEIGKNINILDYVDDDAEPKKVNYLEKMIGIYVAEDINQIDQLYEGKKSQKFKDIVLINRNKKMAMRMDSLAHIRNSFFAVGAAHLPGDSGLIQLLQGRGFTVEPVFSSKKIAPEKYNYTAVVIPWVKFYEPDSAYVVEMPGKASDLKVIGDDFKLKVYTDLSNSITYMTGFTFTTSTESSAARLERMAKSLSGKGFEKLDEKKIVTNGLEGTELFSVRQKIYYRLRLLTTSDKIYMVMAGAEKKEPLYSKDAERFFKSFSANEKLEAKPNHWIDHADRKMAFEISFPKKPGVDKLPATDNAGNFETISYTAIDIANNTFYLVAINQTTKGFMIMEDSVLFNSKLNYYRQANAVISDERKFEYEGYPAFSFSALINKEGMDFVSKLLIICRGNRSYTIAAITEKGKEDFPDISRFFRSFKLTPFLPALWQMNTPASNSFSTWTPAAIEVEASDTTGLTSQQLKKQNDPSKKAAQYLSFDPNSVANYYIHADPVAKYYWTKNDSSFLAEQVATFFTDTSSYLAKNKQGNFDSLIYKKTITNGNAKGVEVLVKNAAKTYYKRVRVFQYGDSSYQLFTLAPYDIITNENNNKFFEDFRFTKELAATTIFNNKTKLIVADLQSTDSTTKANAAEALTSTKFTAEDLPLLHQAYLAKYPVDTNDYRTIPDRIESAIKEINDSSTIQFVNDKYSTVAAGLPEIKMGMLNLLASQKKLAALLLLKKLVLKDAPAKGSIYSMFYQLGDSLLLAKELFPEVTGLYSDTVMGPGMMRLASELIDSNLLSKDIAKLNINAVMSTAKSQLKKLQKNEDDFPPFNSYVTEMLAKVNSKESVDLLKRFLTVKEIYTKQNIVLSLIKINQAVPPLEIQKVAADVGSRTEFYKSLKQIGKEKLFPKEFLTQQQFAQSYLYNYESDGEEESKVTFKFVAEKIVSNKGVQSRYYIFKMTAAYDEEATSYLSVCGPFDMNKTIPTVTTTYGDIKIFYDEKFDPKNTNALFDAYIKEIQEEKELKK